MFWSVTLSKYARVPIIKLAALEDMLTLLGDQEMTRLEMYWRIVLGL